MCRERPRFPPKPSPSALAPGNVFVLFGIPEPDGNQTTTYHWMHTRTVVSAVGSGAGSKMNPRQGPRQISNTWLTDCKPSVNCARHNNNVVSACLGGLAGLCRPIGTVPGTQDIYSNSRPPKAERGRLMVAWSHDGGT